MDKFLKFLLALVMIIIPLLIKAQDCDDTYRRGVELRKTLTIEAQNQAIYFFQQARECFTDDAGRTRCDRQIELCCKVIRRLGGTPVLAHNEPQSAAEPAVVVEPTEEPQTAVTQPADTVVVEIPVAVEDTVAVAVEVAEVVDPSASESEQVVETPAEEQAEETGDIFTVKDDVTFDYKDVKPFVIQYDPAEEPVLKYKNGWIEVKIEDGEITITAADNDGAERTGRVIIAGKTMRYQYNVTQKRKKGFKIF